MLSTDPSYDNRTIASTLKMRIWIATNNKNVFRVMKTKFPATVMVFGVVSSEGHIMPPHIFEVGLKVNTKVYLDMLKSVVIPWCNQVATTHPNSEEKTITQEEKNECRDYEKNYVCKENILSSLRNQDWKTVKVETEKISDLLTSIPTNNITDLNNLIYTGAKLVSKKVGFLLKKKTKMAKQGWEIKL